MVEDMWGLSYDKPAKHMRSYLEVLVPGLKGEPVNCQNDLYSVNLMVAPPVENPIPLLIAALGPAMLRIAGELAGGTITWATGVRTLGDHIARRISRAAESFGLVQSVAAPINPGARDKPDDAFLVFRATSP